MKVSLNWLKEFIHLSEKPEDLTHLLTMSGLEVEGLEKFESIQGGLEGVVIGKVLTCGKHPNADKLSVTTVDVGESDPLPIVCGAPNVAEGQKVAVALVGATLYPTEGNPFKIKKAKIRGEVSQGMICAEDELGLGSGHDGIMVLDTDLPNGTSAKDYFKITEDQVIEIGLTPNRADAASHFGVARDLKALLDRPLCFPEVKDFPAGDDSRVIGVEIENPEACPRYSGVTITGITVKPSPDWLKEKLEAIGLAPINNVVDVTNYVLHGLGQPMHAFDADKITGDRILVKTLPQDTPFVTLDGTERKLATHDLMICNTASPMCIAGVFGGKDSGVTEQTTSVFLESAYFSPDYVRRTSLGHGLKTDAAFRFERGTDPEMTVPALKLAASLIVKLTGGKITSPIIDEYPKRIAPFEVNVKYANVNRLIGKAIPRETVKKILANLEISILEDDGEKLLLKVPAYRVDVQREADVVEEILRIYGYDNIELSTHLSASYLAGSSEKDKSLLQTKITEMLAGIGFQELFTNSLTSGQYSQWLESVKEENNVEILNILSEELDVMRQSMIFSGLEAIAYNLNRRQNDLKFFEFGSVYQKVEKGYKENQVLTFFMSGDKQSESWQQKSEKAIFHQIAAPVKQVLQRLGLQTSQQPSDFSDFTYGLDYTLNGKTMAKAGLLKLNLAKKAEIKQEVLYAELDWDLAIKQYQQGNTYQEISRFPEVRRDLSLVMDQRLTFDQVKELALNTERNLLRELNVFDVYEGEKLEDGKKSYSVSFILQDTGKTLTDKVIDKTMNRLMQAFEKELGIVIRK